MSCQQFLGWHLIHFIVRDRNEAYMLFRELHLAFNAGGP